MKLKVYIRVIDKDSGRAAWYNDTKFEEDYDTGEVTVHENENKVTEQYFVDGWCIYGDGCRRGTPFTTVNALRRAKKEADVLASFDGWDTKVELWKETSKKFVPVKINLKTNRLKNLDPKKFCDPKTNPRKEY